MEQFISDVVKMREAQKEFFSMKTKQNLIKAKNLESIVDKALRDINKQPEKKSNQLNLL